jgi:hypothetical protein
MACLTAPAAIAIVTTVCGKKIPAKFHINWLNALLWGGVAGLAIEHIAHEEIVPYFPFLSAMKTPADTATMLHEILTTGIAMLVACTVVWISMVVIASSLKTKSEIKTREAN